MKKLLFIVAALVLVASGVAAVSAYEAHLINVKAHVELALTVDTAEINFGTVFPEEWLVRHRDVQLSTSAVTELGAAGGDLQDVVIQVFAEWKQLEIGPPVTYYPWMGYFTYIGWNVDGSASAMSLIGAPLAVAPSAQPVGLTHTFNTSDIVSLYVGIDVPDFQGYVNALTDPNPKPSGLLEPTWVIPTTFPGFNPQGMDFGVDLKIQVVDINRVQ